MNKRTAFIYLNELKNMQAADLVAMAEAAGLENLARSRKQDIIFEVLKVFGAKGESIYGEGTLEILQDGFGFLRSADSSFLAGPDDIYVSPSQIRRFNLRTGDTVGGLIRLTEGRRTLFRAYSKLLKSILMSPRMRAARWLFENLTPLFPTRGVGT